LGGRTTELLAIPRFANWRREMAMANNGNGEALSEGILAANLQVHEASARTPSDSGGVSRAAKDDQPATGTRESVAEFC